MVMALTMVTTKVVRRQQSHLQVVRLSVVLCASLLAGSLLSSGSLSFISDYSLYRLSAASGFALVAILSMLIAITTNRSERYLCYILASCMLISSMFNVIMINHTMYYLLVDIKQNNAVSWKNIYFSIELAIGFIVGINGLHYIASRCINFCNRFCAIVRNNSIYHERDN